MAMLKGSFNRLLASVQTAKGVGPATAAKLRARGIQTLEDVLFFLPTRYQDRRTVTPLAGLTAGEEAVVSGRITAGKVFGSPGRPKRFQLTLTDDSGRLTVTWFNARQAQARGMAEGQTLTLVGRVGEYQGQLTMNHPEVVPDPGDDASGVGRFVPVYRDIPGVSDRVFRRLVRTVVDHDLVRAESPLPRSVIADQSLLDLDQAFERVHFPGDETDIAPDGPPRRTLIFTELFLHQACLATARRNALQNAAPRVTGFDDIRREIAAGLPFELTGAQHRALDGLAADLALNRPMNRLLQGDVGSGKTVVAAVALIAAARAGVQGAMMAPTEILARQHYQAIKPLADSQRLTLALLTGSTPAPERKSILEALARGAIRLVVGTHSLIQQTVEFKRLGLAVVDEQHRFGVAQRASLGAKGEGVHALVMTATPIPRSLALTLYGDLDVSIIDEKPDGRQAVVTRLLPRSRLERAWQAIDNAAGQGLQSFVVLPAIDSGPDLASVEERYTGLKSALPKLNIGLIHGRLDRQEQVRVMAAFTTGELDVLVATTVIEVGVDVPRAALMIIEDAERFGLAQIHQLRGRVGRGDSPAACLLVSDAGGASRQRLKTLEETDDGFAIAEADLKLRGPGEFLGRRQTGMPDFRLANLVTDTGLLARARKAAFDLVKADPDLEKAEHRILADIVARRLKSLALPLVTG